MSRLPVRCRPAPGQCITDWLEHVAEDNGLLTTQLDAMLRMSGGTARFLAVRPEPRTLRSITALTGTTTSQVVPATLERFDGTALNLEGLDPQRWSSWRKVAARGWFRPRGTAACPRCLAEEGRWRIEWRLPTVTVCTRHGCYLVETCPSCKRRFADHPHTPLRHGAGTRCLNPLGGRTWCDHDAAALAPQPAAVAEVVRQQRHNSACDRKAVMVLGVPEAGGEFLADVRHLAVLLLHLATWPGTGRLAPWVDGVQRESKEKARVRWHLSPPADPLLRSAVLTTADSIITAPDCSAGAELLAPWVELVPPGPESRLGWLADHTRMTPTLTRLVMATLAPHRRVSHALAARPRRLDQRMIPQVLPADLYHQHAAGLFMTREYTPRLFLSLCLARRSGAGTWAEAATLLGLGPDLGTRTARAVSARSTLDPHALTEVLDRIAELLDINHRIRQDAISRLARRRAWFEDWSAEHRPGTRAESHRFAVTWLWEHWAHALVTTSPGWPAPPDRFERALYRQFATSLRQPATDALTDLAHQTVQQEQR